jgi:bacterioferritin (cytochrome b1)
MNDYTAHYWLTETADHDNAADSWRAQLAEQQQRADAIAEYIGSLADAELV